jgi:FtsH-binding integral membrane protein
MKANRMRRFFQTVLPGIIKPLHVLWNELIGFFFGVFALVLGISLARDAMNYKGDPETLFRLVLLGIAFVVMAAYALQSYFKARRIGKS